MWRTYSSEDCPGFSPDSLFIETPKSGSSEPLLMQIYQFFGYAITIQSFFLYLCNEKLFFLT